MKVLVLNGPNLGRLGKREPAVYGYTTHADLAALCEKAGTDLGVEVEVRQTDHEGEMIGWLHEAADQSVPVVLNAGAWTHYSIAIADACAQLTAPLVEVHISNVHKREDFRHHSYISAVASGVIVGLGVQGYPLAIRWISACPVDHDRDSRAEAAPDGTAETPKDNQYSGVPAAPPGTTSIPTLIDRDPRDTHNAAADV